MAEGTEEADQRVFSLLHPGVEQLVAARPLVVLRAVVDDKGRIGDAETRGPFSVQDASLVYMAHARRYVGFDRGEDVAARTGYAERAGSAHRVADGVNALGVDGVVFDRPEDGRDASVLDRAGLDAEPFGIRYLLRDSLGRESAPPPVARICAAVENERERVLGAVIDIVVALRFHTPDRRVQIVTRRVENDVEGIFFALFFVFRPYYGEGVSLRGAVAPLLLDSVGEELHGSAVEQRMLFSFHRRLSPCPILLCF